MGILNETHQRVCKTLYLGDRFRLSGDPLKRILVVTKIEWACGDSPKKEINEVNIEILKSCSTEYFLTGRVEGDATDAAALPPWTFWKSHLQWVEKLWEY